MKYEPLDEKTCIKCGEIKQKQYFRKANNNKSGIYNYCTECFKKSTKIYEKTKTGYLMRIYRNMKSRISGIQKEKYHLYKNKELLSKEDFYKWAENSESFTELFKKYKEYGHERKLAPSVDRIDSSKGYTLDNMEWVTMSENSSRGAKSKKRLK